MVMQTPNTQRLNWQHGGAEIPTVLLVILLNVNVLRDQCAGQWRDCGFPSTKTALFMDGNEKRGWLKVYDSSASLAVRLIGMTYWRM